MNKTNISFFVLGIITTFIITFFVFQQIAPDILDSITKGKVKTIQNNVKTKSEDLIKELEPKYRAEVESEVKASALDKVKSLQGKYETRITQLKDKYVKLANTKQQEMKKFGTDEANKARAEITTYASAAKTQAETEWPKQIANEAGDVGMKIFTEKIREIPIARKIFKI